MALESFPPLQYPIVGGATPALDYYKWFKSVDVLLRGTNTPLTRAAADALYEAIGQLAGINTQTGNYVLVLGDKGWTIEMSVAGANTLTIPPNASVAFPVKSYINIAQIGAGQTTLTPGAGVTIRSFNGALKLAGQYALATLYQRAANEWVAGGNLVV